MLFISDNITNFYNYEGLIRLKQGVSSLVASAYSEEVLKINNSSKATVVCPSVSYLLPNLPPGTYNFSLEIFTQGANLLQRNLLLVISMLKYLQSKWGYQLVEPI